MSDYTAIIPVAGKGLRLLPYTAHMPKTMLCVAGRPIIAHILEQIEQCGIKKVVFVVGYQKQVLMDYAQKHYAHLHIEFVEQKEPKGLGHAIYQAKEFVKGPCLIVLGDTIIDGNLRPLVQSGKNCVGVKEVEDPRRFGVVQIQDNCIVDMEEKPENPKSNIALIGAYSFLDSQQLFDAIEKVISSGKTVKNEIQLTDALALLLKQAVCITPVFMTNWYDCGTVEVLLHTNQILLEKKSYVPEKFLKNNKIIAPCWIDDSAIVENCVLGPNVSVAEGAVLKNNVIENSIISADTYLLDKKQSHKIFDKYNC